LRLLKVRPNIKSKIAKVKHLRVNKMSSQFSDSNSKYILNRISKDLEFSILQTGSLFLKKIIF